MISLLNGFFFFFWMVEIFQKGCQRLANGTNVVSQLSIFCFVFTSTVYGPEEVKVDVLTPFDPGQVSGNPTGPYK